MVLGSQAQGCSHWKFNRFSQVYIDDDFMKKN